MSVEQLVALGGAIIATLVGTITTLFWALNRANESRIADKDKSNTQALADKDKEIEWVRGLVTELRRDGALDKGTIEKLTEMVRELRETVLNQTRARR